MILVALCVVILSPLAGSARTVKVGIGFALPPYVLRESDSGLEVEIVREAFRRVGHDVEFVYLPNLRLPVEFAEGSVDCVVANKAYNLASDSGRPVYPSFETLAYRNYAITLKRSGHVIRSLDDLCDKRVLGFKNATKYLGEKYAEAVGKNGDYSELSDQSLQVRMLLSGRVQVVISDKRIFKWWRKQLANESVATNLELSAPVSFHPVFPPAPRTVHFGDANLRNAFNQAVRSMRTDGRFQAIMDDYLDNEH